MKVLTVVTVCPIPDMSSKSHVYEAPVRERPMWPSRSPGGRGVSWDGEKRAVGVVDV